MRINIGCGQTPTKGWRNFDGSPSLHLAKISVLPALLYRIGLLQQEQYQFIQFIQAHKIEYGDVTRRLPLSDSSVEVLYSSHMLEHLERAEADRFLHEAKRILRPGGVIRLVVPDIHKQVLGYLNSRDADAFMSETFLCCESPKTLMQRFKAALITSRAHHRWMYDAASLCRLLEAHEFVNVAVVPAGETRITNPDPLNLVERCEESIYVEAESP